MEYLILLNALLAAADKLIPIIRDQAQKGEISDDDQAATHEKYVKVRDSAEELFSGPQWKQSGQ